MVLFLIEISKYWNIVLAALYCLLAFIALGRKDEDGRNGIFHVLEFITLLLFVSGVAALALSKSYIGDPAAMRNVILLGLAEAVGMFALARLMYHFYPEMNRLLFADMEFMLCIGFVVLMRLKYSHALRQYIIIVAGLAVSMFIPMLIHKFKLIKKMGWICGAAGAAALLVVYIHGSITNGAKLSMKIFGLTFQPSEIIKILFAFFIAGILYKSAKFINIVIAAACASALIIILTISRDLGMALIYFVMLISMIYMASGKIRYVLLGAGAGAGAGAVAYSLFSHVRVRFNVWMDPWTDIDNTGYQLSQSLFAIGTGNWFGLGIGRGKPTTIPDVEEDFIFSAIAEESGLIFGMILILVCLNLLIAMLLMVGRVKDNFFRIAGMGMAVCYGIQTVLTIGGGTMFIPLTGVTLPLVSNGGSSAMATLLLFAVLQGISLIRMDEIYDGVESDAESDPKPEEKKSPKKEKAIKSDKPVKKEKIKKEPRESRRRNGKGIDTVRPEVASGAAMTEVGAEETAMNDVAMAEAAMEEAAMAGAVMAGAAKSEADVEAMARAVKAGTGIYARNVISYSDKAEYEDVENGSDHDDETYEDDNEYPEESEEYEDDIEEGYEAEDESEYDEEAPDDYDTEEAEDFEDEDESDEYDDENDIEDPDEYEDDEYDEDDLDEYEDDEEESDEYESDEDDIEDPEDYDEDDDEDDEYDEADPEVYYEDDIEDTGEPDDFYTDNKYSVNKASSDIFDEDYADEIPDSDKKF